MFLVYFLLPICCYSGNKKKFEGLSRFIRYSLVAYRRTAGPTNYLFWNLTCILTRQQPVAYAVYSSYAGLGVSSSLTDVQKAYGVNELRN